MRTGASSEDQDPSMDLRKLPGHMSVTLPLAVTRRCPLTAAV